MTARPAPQPATQDPVLNPGLTDRASCPQCTFMETIEAVGCIHLHSIYSDGSGTIGDLIEAAAETGLDYLILTDHHSIRARQLGLEGWLGSTLLIVGHEAGQSKGHLLAIDTPRKIRVHSAEASHIVERPFRGEVSASWPTRMGIPNRISASRIPGGRPGLTWDLPDWRSGPICTTGSARSSGGTSR